VVIDIKGRRVLTEVSGDLPAQHTEKEGGLSRTKSTCLVKASLVPLFTVHLAYIFIRKYLTTKQKSRMISILDVTRTKPMLVRNERSFKLPLVVSLFVIVLMNDRHNNQS